ncbi:VTC domain-containing protein [Nocardioides panacisoli]|uniref:VTC domain-containing protein n=1 Tax=Nocardioides panacisoli TaxID=627624 RepID=UPI001C630A67|nr:VTC domain-containing protein [Nocardioides panacisoli]QYJ03349.1 VTC domain-containing protein [Nocardioides panacisoli]
MSALLAHVDTGLDGFTPASLDDLAEHAALMTRTDRKYVVPQAALPELVAAIGALDAAPRVLEIDGRHHHRYASTYLDTPDLDAYWRSARRRRRRFKVRSREYRDVGTAFTEVKTRGMRGSTVKTRVPRGGGRPGVERDVLPREDTDFVRDALASAALGHVDVAALVPTLRTSYARTTLWLPGSGARVTVDTDLSWQLPWSPHRTRVPGVAIVETKTPAAGTGVDRALWARGHRPDRISKFATGLALVWPDLPSHRWHRVLQRHLRPAARHDHHQER